jgi:hypothetical protein
MNSTRQNHVAKERFTFLASPLDWSVYYIVVYLLVEFACGLGLLIGAVRALTLALMLPTLAVIIYAGWRGQAGQAQAAQMKGELESEEDPAQMQHFSGEVGVWLSGVFVLLTLAVGAAALVLQPC